jgi:arylsulfatase A-like enzyme
MKPLNWTFHPQPSQTGLKATHPCRGASGTHFDARFALSRHGFALLAIVGVCILGAGALAAQNAGTDLSSIRRAGADAPNILLIMAEDIGPDLSCYGTPLVRTPNLDAIAARGVRYQNCFTTAPVCSTSRSALMTGMYQTSIGAHQHRTWQWNKKPLPPGVHTLTDYFRAAGYFTCNLAPDPPAEKSATKAKRGPAGSRGAGKTDFNFLTSGPPFDGNDWNQRARGQPFFAQITIQESHKGPGWPLARQVLGKACVPPDQVKLPPYYPDHPVARDEYANYLDAIMLVDRYVGEIMARLEADGLAKNTVVVFIGDNGQCLFRSKQFLYDGGLHLPLLIAWPDQRRAGEVDERLISHIDLSAALIGLAGIKPLPAMQGRNFLDSSTPPRPHVFAARDRMDASIDRMRCVRTARFKYIRNYFPMIPYQQHNAYKERSYPTWNLVKELAREGKLTPEAALFASATKPIEELFDLQADPHEVKNLAADPAYRTTLKEMRGLVDAWVRDTNDQGHVGEDPIDIYRGYNGRLPEDPPGRPRGGKR